MKNLLLLISCLTFFAAEAQVNVFTGAIDTSWNNPNNWSLVTLPSPTMDVQISNGKTALLNVDTSINSIHLQGTAVLIIQANMTIGTLQESNSAPLSIISWGGGNISGGTLNILGLLDIIPGGKQLTGGADINLTGRMTQDTDWGIDIVDGDFTVQPEGVIELINSQRNITGSGSGSHRLTNYGLIKKLGAGTSTISAQLRNFGTITVQSGNINLSNAEMELHGGTYNTALGTSLIFGATETLSGTLSGDNLGEIHWSGTMNVPVTAEFNFSGNGLFNWGNGHLTGGGILINSGLLQMTGAYYGTKYIEGGTTLTNNSTIVINTDWSLDITNGTLNNTANGILDFQFPHEVLATGTGSHILNNNGLIKKTGLVSNIYIRAQLYNTGTISAESGYIHFSNPLTVFNGGTYNASAGNYLFNDQTVTCSGTLTGVLDGNFNWISDINVPVAATFNFTGNGINNWAAGTIKGGGILTNEGIFEFSPGWVGNRFISESTTINNVNTIKVTSDQTVVMNGGTITNQAGATFDIQNPGALSAGTGTNIINNFGLLKKSASTGTYSIGATINNTGIIQADAGTLQLGSLNNTTNGIVKGTAYIQLPTAPNFTSDGIFAPGGEPGTLTIIGNYQSTANTRFNVQLYGLTQGTQYDTMLIQGNAAMAGTVVPELYFDPAIGSSFLIANTWGTITSCNLATTATAIYNGQQYTFSVGCQDDNKVILTLTQKTLANEEFIPLERQIVLAPNPAKNFILITNNSNVLLNEALISDASGRIIQLFKLDNNDNQIDLTGYSAGIYFMKVNSAEGSVVKRFIVE
ncbi:T9SS type A sorting domain-containing protein [Flavobacterium wongokense]|uniref:T9SS type A sorting domain-containing protein n=1 Tax=Flavobacterium wongokense TaxID=2910674 RepID=UPI001F3B3ABF|nr:T9SS type A sorting domain-containing protein [Flavobacterium sp. WG47]MCF6131210.1 T9SS type A sorting domain-containing protein [Flavobacterium sp. WG47]